MNPAIVFDHILKDLGIDEGALKNTLTLLGNGATVPFIARYRKEVTGELDEVQIRSISEKFVYYSELEARKEAILKSIRANGAMPPGLENKITSCRQKYVLEDLYLPYKPRQRTRATIAREKGLGPLADIILVEQPLSGRRDDIAERFISQDKGIATAQNAIDEALEIVIESIVENADIRALLRGLYLKKGVLISRVRHELDGVKTKFEAYYKHAELISKAASHRILAIRRGAKEQILLWEIQVPEDQAIKLVESRVIKNKGSVFSDELLRAVVTAYKRTLSTSIEAEVFGIRLDDAGREAIEVFSKNLRNLLLAPPSGEKVVMGVDPGIKTGCKVAVVDRNGNFCEYEQVFLHESARLKNEAEKTLRGLIDTHRVELIAIGNGTASKDVFVFIKEMLKRYAIPDVKVVMVSEAGASVYSASDAARLEFPELDVTVRGAISIARRLQDPLAELVKIDPKAIGVGQYQHDVNQKDLKAALDGTVESCVNFVGVDLNTSSAELLTYVAGVGPFLSRAIVRYRREKGAFKDKAELLKVPGLGAKTFEQCAGFVKIRGTQNPLNNSTIHPESFHIVERMAKDLGVDVITLVGNEGLVDTIDLRRYVTKDAGIPTLNDIANELVKPGIDPRSEFSSVEFSEAINDICDLSVGMTLEGVVTNVANFGAFVDIGVHQDGLIHISRLSDRFVRDPHEVIAVGDHVKVKVLSVDKVLKHISLERTI